jgi:hypothetical protein
MSPQNDPGQVGAERLLTMSWVSTRHGQDKALGHW